MSLEIGRQKATHRIRVIDLANGKSKTFSVYQKGETKKLEEITVKIIEALRS